MAALTLAPNSTWFSPSITSIKRANITQINIVDSYTPTGSETAFWDASADKDGSVMAYVAGTVLTLAGNGGGKIYANSDSSYTFSSSGSDKFSELTTITGLNLLNTQNVTTMNRMFAQCKKLTAAAGVSSWDTSACTNMYGVFQVCLELTDLNLADWDVSKVETMYGMFMSIESMGFMKLTSIGSVGNWNVEKVKNMGSMFQLCKSLTTLDTHNWKPSSCTNMNSMFYGCTSLTEIDASNWDVSKVTNMASMFSSVDRFGDMVITTIGDVGNWNVSEVTTMSGMFQRCTFIESLDLSNWDTSSCVDMGDMFNKMSGLKKITIGAHFSFRGGGIADTEKIAVLPTPSSENIPGADGNWYDIDKTAYAAADVPGNALETYYASTAVVDAEENEVVFVKQGSLIRAARAIRSKNGLSEQYRPAEFANAILAIGS